MPRKGRGPHLWLHPERRDAAGQITHTAIWYIKDGRHRQSTQRPQFDLTGAERALQFYLDRKHQAGAHRGPRDPAEIAVADVLAFYAEHVASRHARPKETLAHIHRLGRFFGDKTLADINGDLCRGFVRARKTTAGAREDLVALRAAINFYREEGYCDRIVSVTLPEKGAPRERWLTRNKAATLIWHAWRYREMQKGRPSDRRSRRHVARFILVALYTGTRASAVCAAAFDRIANAGYVDLEEGIFYRRPAGSRETKKRRPPVPLPPSLLAHLRRWKRRGQRFCVEWNGDPVRDVDKAFRRNARDCSMPDVTPHTLRHTAATWQMQAGTDLWQAARFLGMTAEQLERTYGHHHPDHLKGAVEAYGRLSRRRRERKEAATRSRP